MLTFKKQMLLAHSTAEADHHNIGSFAGLDLLQELNEKSGYHQNY